MIISNFSVTVVSLLHNFTKIKMTKSIVADLIQIFKSSVSSVLPENLIRKTLQYNPTNQQLTIAGKVYNLQNKNVYLVGTGKAVQNMASEIENILSSKIKRGIISIPEGSLNCKAPSSNVFYYEGAKNNLPDVNAEKTARKIKDLVTGLDKNDLLLVLISGGGSALLPLPKQPVSLKDKTELIKNLGNSGADIMELNTVRKKISDLKGGQLALDALPAQVVSLILSDIVGDPLDLIASGPTVENKDDPAKALNIIKKYNLFDNLSEAIKTSLNETGDSKPFPIDNVRNHIIGSNKLSIAAALEEARNLNYFPLDLSNTVTGNVKDVANEYSKLATIVCDLQKGKLDKNVLKSRIDSLRIPGINIDIKHIDSMKDKDICLILGGEITVEVKGKGKGGRNQQLALEFANYIHNIKEDLKGFDIYLLSAGTDGIDGPTDAAGAISYTDLISDATEKFIDVKKYLENNDSYNFYKEFNKGSLHVITGHTNTNVMDIHLILITRSKNYCKY